MIINNLIKISWLHKFQFIHTYALDLFHNKINLLLPLDIFHYRVHTIKWYYFYCIYRMLKMTFVNDMNVWMVTDQYYMMYTYSCLKCKHTLRRMFSKRPWHLYISKKMLKIFNWNIGVWNTCCIFVKGVLLMNIKRFWQKIWRTLMLRFQVKFACQSMKKFNFVFNFMD